MPYLKRVAGINLAKVNMALQLLVDWARRHHLTPSETVYVAWTSDRHRLRFTKTGDAVVERAWRTHWISPALSEAKLARRTRQQATVGTPAGKALLAGRPIRWQITDPRRHMAGTHTITIPVGRRSANQGLTVPRHEA